MNLNWRRRRMAGIPQSFASPRIHLFVRPQIDVPLYLLLILVLPLLILLLIL